MKIIEWIVPSSVIMFLKQIIKSSVFRSRIIFHYRGDHFGNWVRVEKREERILFRIVDKEIICSRTEESVGFTED